MLDLSVKQVPGWVLTLWSYAVYYLFILKAKTLASSL